MKENFINDIWDIGLVSVTFVNVENTYKDDGSKKKGNNFRFLQLNKERSSRIIIFGNTKSTYQRQKKQLNHLEYIKRKNLSSLVVNMKVERYKKENGYVYIPKLYLVGASWDPEKNILSHQRTKQNILKNEIRCKSIYGGYIVVHQSDI